MKASKYAEIILNSIQENGGDFEMIVTSADLSKNPKINLRHIFPVMQKELDEIRPKD